MTTLEALLTSIVADAREDTRWLVLADWLEEHDRLAAAELLRLHRRMLETCQQPRKPAERVKWQSRIVDLLESGVRPCLPRRTIELPGCPPMRFAFISPGTFRMGARDQEASERPIHTVTLTRGFYLGMHPVTQLQWRALMGTGPTEFVGDELPAHSMTWEQSVAFCSRLTEHLAGTMLARLPTEAEWEYACRAGTTTAFYTGDGTAALRKAGWYGLSPDRGPQPVGRLTPNPWDLYDMHGNVWEYTSDWYGSYSPRAAEDPAGPEFGRNRVIRGGSWRSSPEVFARASIRRARPPRRSSTMDGFRVVLETPASAG
jgi:uncharacterized protein (TIGR02996 family)